MTLHISEREVRELLTMPMAIEAVDVISRRQANGEARLHPRKRIELHGGGFFHYMAAADFTAGYLAMKLYTFVRGQLCFVVPLYEIATGKMVALIEADVLGQLRTGAASGIATKYLARRDARVVSVIVVDSIEQSREEAGDLIVPFGRDEARWNQVSELAQLVAGKARGRSKESEITLFKSNGIAVWDLAVAARVFRLAIEKGKGRPLPLWAEASGN